MHLYTRLNEMTLQPSIVLALQASILMTVFTFGLRTTVGDALYVVRQPSLLGRSLVTMFVIMPFIAVALVRAFALRPSVEIVLVALAISPIPPLLPVRQQKAGGYAPYALGLMLIVGTASIVIVPAAMWLLGRYFVQPFSMPPAAIARLALMTVVLPLATGLGFRAVLPAVAERIAKPVSLVATVLLVVGVLGLLAGGLRAALALAGNGTIIAMAAFVVAGLAVGHWLGGPDKDHRVVLALSAATRHPMIALTIAKANFPDEPNLGAAILLFILVNALIGIPYQWRLRR